MRNRISALIIMMILFLNSCGPTVSIKKTEIKYWDHHFSQKFSNYGFENDQHKGLLPTDQTLLKVLNIDEDKIDSISIWFGANQELKLSYMSKGQVNEKTFAGKFTKRGYYEYYFKNQHLDIPPGFSIIYSNNDIERVRLAINLKGDLVIDYMYYKSRNILILGNGISSNNQYVFKRS